MPLNRPYAFELAAMAVVDPGRHNDFKDTAERNGVGPDQFDRAAAILKTYVSSVESLEDFVRREYFLDGWLHGYLPL